MPKVLFFIPYSTEKGIDGASKILSFVVNGLNGREFEKWVVSLAKGEISAFLRGENITERVIPEDCLKTMDRVYQSPDETPMEELCSGLERYVVTTPMFRFISELKPDIVYANTTMAINGAVMGKLAGAKVVWHIHDIGQSFLSERNCSRLNALVERYADKIIGVGKAVQESLGSAGQSHKFEVVYNGVEVPGATIDQQQQTRAILRKQYGVLDKMVFAYLGQIVPHKGVHFFIQSASLPGRHLENVEYWIIGDPRKDERYTKKLANLVQQNNMTKRIRSVGYFRDIGAILPAVDCLVVPSAFEDPLPTVVIEGNLFHKPVIAFQRGGISEIIVHNRNGLLVQKDSIEHMAEAMNQMYSHPAHAVEMGEFGYRRGRNRFGLQRFVQNIEEILREVTAGILSAHPLRTGSLVQGGSGEIFWVLQGRKHRIPNEGALDQLGFGMQDIRAVEDQLLTQIPDGPNYPEPAGGSL